MADLPAIQTQIRFQLEQLSQRNAAHDFEDLCRHFARARICANILPATGPVQSGGDQGRDFETFRSHLPTIPHGNYGFVGFTDKPIVFACSLDQSVRDKVKHDVHTIMNGGAPVDEVHFFSSRDIAVAIRHELQNWARDDFGLHLEIYDGFGLSELLCAPDIFWIAERYLYLPSELFPSIPDSQPTTWYERVLDKWRRDNSPARTYADYTEIRAAAQRAKGPYEFDECDNPITAYKLPEFPFWLSRLDELIAEAHSAHLRRLAIHISSILHLRGLGSLHGREFWLREYYSAIHEFRNPSEFDDASSLLTYCSGAQMRGLVGLNEDELDNWFTEIGQRLTERLERAERQELFSEQCALLEISGHHAIRLCPGIELETKIGEALVHWKRLVDLVPNAPLFPLERFADRLSEGAAYYSIHPDFDVLVDEVDVLLRDRFGEFAIADKCLKRAEAFRHAGDVPRAMAQLHRAKIKWFAPETLRRSLTALLMLSHLYQRQQLWFAAKYYALAASHVALHADDLRIKPIIAKGIFDAAGCDYANGAWHGFLELMQTAALIYPHYAHNPDRDFNDHNGTLQIPFTHLNLLSAVTRRIHPQLDSFALERSTAIADSFALLEAFDQTLPMARAVWEDEQVNIWDAIGGQVPTPPWSDSGRRRQVTWRAHGITWDFTWDNQYRDNIAVEEFLVAFQILLSDLAGHDLVLLRTTVAATICFLEIGFEPEGSYKGFDAQFEPSNIEHNCVVTLPSTESWFDGTITQEDLRAGMLSIAMCLLTEVSLLPDDALMGILGDRFNTGLSHKLLIGAPYRRVTTQFVSKDEYDASERIVHPPIQVPQGFTPRVADEIPWVRGDGPGYDYQSSVEAIGRRYTHAIRPIRETFSVLKRDPAFRTIVKELRAEGWLDWQILTAVANTAISFKLNQISAVPDIDADSELLQELANSVESAGTFVPTDEFTIDVLRQHLKMICVLVLQTYGLQVHEATPDFDAIKDLLTCRYNFMSDDVEHEDILAQKQ